MERIGDSVRRLARETATPDIGALAEIVEAWPVAVGDAIARAAWPARLARDGTLHVATTSSTWAFELAGLAPRITERLQETLGASAPPALRFAPGPVPEPSAPLPSRDSRPAVVTTAGDRAAAASLTAGIADEELRRSIARAAAASLARERSGRGF